MAVDNRNQNKSRPNRIQYKRKKPNSETTQGPGQTANRTLGVKKRPWRDT